MHSNTAREQFERLNSKYEQQPHFHSHLSKIYLEMFLKASSWGILSEQAVAYWGKKTIFTILKKIWKILTVITINIFLILTVAYWGKKTIFTILTLKKILTILLKIIQQKPAANLAQSVASFESSSCWSVGPSPGRVSPYIFSDPFNYIYKVLEWFYEPY